MAAELGAGNAADRAATADAWEAARATDRVAEAARAAVERAALAVD
ncbi:MAG: hypothetical protein ABIL09_12605 [Gemmatimonadota bacterium]